MIVSFERVDNILKTLPIGYYAKRNIPVTLNRTSSISFYVPVEDRIEISFNQITESLADLDETFNEETAIRTMLYHEVSHAILTPKDLSYSDWINIFEDERIETVLRDFYKGVNFKQMIYNLTKQHGFTPENAEQAFYLFVRLRIVDKLDKEYWINRLTNLISEYRTVNDSWWYYCDIEKFHQDFIDAWNKMKEEEKSKDAEIPEGKEETSKNNDTDETSENETSENEEETSEETSEEEEEETSMYDHDRPDENIPKDLDVKPVSIEEILDNTSFGMTYDKALTDELFAIFGEAKKMNKQNASAINAYSGMFDVRSVLRDDCKYFLQKNREGHRKAYSKMHLNLFIDCSGSFYRDDIVINRMLTALIKIEKINPNFSFDLISCGSTNVVRAKNDRIQHSRGGNRLDQTIVPCYNKVQLKDAMNINIVCFDGDAWSNICSGVSAAQKSCSVWNNQNSVIISDYDNEYAFTKYCPSARKIFTHDYTKELQKSIISALKTLVR